MICHTGALRPFSSEMLSGHGKNLLNCASKEEKDRARLGDQLEAGSMFTLRYGLRSIPVRPRFGNA